MGETKIVTYKANGGHEIIPNLVIMGNIPLPHSTLYSLEEWGVMYKREGKKIVDAMIECLPGGLIDAILLELFDKKKSLLAVPFVEPHGGKNE